MLARLLPDQARWVALLHEVAHSPASLAAPGVESNLGKAKIDGESGSGLRGTPSAKVISHSPHGL